MYVADGEAVVGDSGSSLLALGPGWQRALPWRLRAGRHGASRTFGFGNPESGWPFDLGCAGLLILDLGLIDVAPAAAALCLFLERLPF